jgi:putative uncharacterized protein nirJ2
MAVLSNEYFLLGNQIYGKKGTKSYILNDAAYRQVKLAIDKDNTSPLSPANAKFLREKGVIYESNEINNPVCVISDMNLCRLFVQLTNRCNLRCKHCFVESDMTKDDYLTYERIIKVVNDAVDLGINRIDFTGGEVLTKPYFLDVLRYLDTQPVSYNFFSNLTLANDNVIEELAKLKGLTSIITSIDYLEPKKHNKFRGGEMAFERTLHAITRLNQKNVKVIVNTMVMDDNRDSLGDLVEFFINQGVETHFDTIIDCGRAKCDQRHNLDADKNIECIRQAISLIADKGISVDNAAGACGVSDTLIFLHYSGKYMLCPGLTSDISDKYVLGTDMRKAWEKSRELHLRCSHIDCEKYDQCSQGCRMRALVDTGSDKGEDPMMCKMMDVKND